MLKITTKKTITLNKIINASIDIFSKRPYEEVALSQICTLSGISNGLIYNYFKTKEELFKFLLNETCNRLDSAFSEIKGNTLEERLEDFILINFKMAKQEYDIIKIYREGQYKFIEYEQKLRNIYIKYLESVYNRTISETEYLYIMSGIRFINVSFTKLNIQLDVKFLVKIILNGIFFKAPLDFSKFQNKILHIIEPFNLEDTKLALLIAGEKLFGKFGYNNVTIQDITKKVGVSVGTFYNHFENKEIFLKVITENLTNSFIFFLKYNVTKSVPLIYKHIEYIYLIIKFFEKTPYRYQIIRESEFISEDISNEYFYKLEILYMNSLKHTDFSESQKKIISNFLMGISHYIGIEMFFTKNINDQLKILETLNYYFSNGSKTPY